MNKPVCVVMGVGPGNGAAFAERFSSEGYRVALVSRSTDFSTALAGKLADARVYACDAGDVEAVTRTFAAIGADLGAVDVLVYNAGPGVFGTIDDVKPADLEQSFRINALGLMAAAQAVIPSMKARKAGNIIVIGATASRRGAARTAAFAPAKAAQRSLTESLARHLGPSGIHVSLVVIDGVVDLPRTRAYMPDKPDTFFVQPRDVASTVLFLAQQPRSAWSFEVEARPFGETW
jgi:NAD(P)-dependent dehydrogenase (short-subunit alcohol dehydrogenase family)